MIEIPNSLLRFLKKQEHARQFVSGLARFGSLECYQRIEDVRRDASEGRSSVYYKAPHPIHAAVVSLNRYYILCTSHPEVDIPLLARKYGRFMVRINNPQELLARIKVAWQNHVLATVCGAFIAPVEYSKDELRDADAGFLPPVHLTYSQKHRSYEEDREYRYMLKCKVEVKGPWENHLTLTLPNCEDICSMSTVE